MAKKKIKEPLDFLAMFKSQVDATEKHWVHNRDSTCGSSEVFACMRKAFFSKNDYPKDEGPEQSWGAARRGDILEEVWIAPAVANHLPEGAELLFAGKEQKTLVDGFLSATPDGLIVGLESDALSLYGVDDILSDCIITEFKTFDSRANITGPKPLHYGQVQSQFQIIHDCTDYRPEYAIIAYVNASFIDDVRAYVIKRDPAKGDAAKKRANMIFSAATPEEMPAEGKISGDCKFCPYTEQCSIATLGSVPTVKHEDMAQERSVELEELLSQERELKAALTETEKKHKQTAEAIKQFLRDEGTRWANVGKFSVSYSTQAGRKTLDKDRLAEELGIDLEPFMKEGQGFEKLTIRTNS